MPLAEGTELGPYQIKLLLGKGGMGEVYLARDIRLDRDVALKVSAAKFSERFEREARTVAQLNHPNVCTLYDVGPNYLVMELVEGETLAERVKEGPIPLDEALRLANQIIDGIEAAHEKGIIHRDLKPANIKIKPDGPVKILDFGLAKQAPVAAASSSVAVAADDSPTLTMGMTEAGMILGTAAYMAPEQAKGKNVDKRADIWAFGVVLHEMLTGERLFKGEDMGDTLAAVIMKEPDLSRAPERVRKLLEKCLEKDPRKRLRDIGDARMLLAEPMAQVVAPVSAPSRSRFSALPWVVAGIMAAMTGWALRPKPTELRSLIRFDVDLGADVSLPPPDYNGSNVILSPDGTRLVYTASVGGGPIKLFIRKMNEARATELPGTEGASAPFFSPDSQWIGFSTGGLPGNKINKISVEGGAVVPIVDGMGGTAAWDEDGSVVIGGPTRGLMRIPFGGSTPSPIAPAVPGEFADWAPQILPGGKGILVEHLVSPGPSSMSVHAIGLADHKRKVVVRGGVSPHYLPDANGVGYLVYCNKSTLFAVAFDPDKLEVHGTPVPVLDDVMPDAQAGAGQFAFSPAGGGTLVYRKGTAGSAGAMSTIQWLDATGKKQPLAAKPGDYLVPRVSPDGKRLAVQIQGPTDIWVYEWQRDAWTKLTSGGAAYISPAWSPDGRYVFFGSIGGGMFWTRSDGARQPQRLTQSNGIQGPWSFTPDGKRLAFVEAGISGGNIQLWTVPIEDNAGQLKAGKPEPFLEDKFNDRSPAFSPDGHWLAYVSDETGRNEVYVRAFPPLASGQGGKWLVSNTGGAAPVWSRSGRELLYQSFDDQVMAVGYTVNGESFVPDKPRVWLPKVGEGNGPDAMWDLAPDGKRVAVVTQVSTPEAPKAEHVVVVLQNFVDELRRRVPVK